MKRTRRFVRLPVLDALEHRVAAAVRDELGNSVLVCVQHLLETTGSLLETLIHLGASPDRTFVLGKPYSVHAGTVKRLTRLGVKVQTNKGQPQLGAFDYWFREDCQELWRRVMQAAEQHRPRRFLILDDGGHATRLAPPHVWPLAIAVEQTTSGVARYPSTPFPIVQVATSAAKRHVEPPLVCRVVAQRARRVLGPTLRRVGIIGVGSIGSALYREMKAAGHEVLAFDSNVALEVAYRAGWAGSVLELARESDVVFGCTGEDVLDESKWYEEIHGEKVFASCSSGDVEFRALLNYATEQGPQDRPALGDVQIRLPRDRGIITILRGGFPVNFDGSAESVPAAEIQVTRGLLLAGVVQALLTEGDHAVIRSQMLAPELQAFVVRKWLAATSSPARDTSECARLENLFSNLEWVQKASAGAMPHVPRLGGLLG